MSRVAVVFLAFGLSGCGATMIPMWDKAGVTRDQEFKDRLACVKERQGFLVPGAGVRKCMEEKGYQLAGYDMP